MFCVIITSAGKGEHPKVFWGPDLGDNSAFNEICPVLQHGSQGTWLQDSLGSEQCQLALQCHHTKMQGLAQWTDRIALKAVRLETLDQSHLLTEEKKKKIKIPKSSEFELEIWKNWLGTASSSCSHACFSFIHHSFYSVLSQEQQRMWRQS